MTRRFTAVAIAAALAVGAAGCGDDDEPESSSSGTPSSESETAAPARLDLTLSGSGKDITMEGPDSVPAGVVEIALTSDVKGDHGAQLIRVDGDQTVEEVNKAGDAWGDGGKPLAPWMHLDGGVVAKQGETVTSTQILEPGRYVAMDIQAEGEIAPATEFEVTEGEGGELPGTEATVTMKEYAFEGSGLKAGSQQVLVDNAGKEPHFIVGAPLAKGATLAEAKKFMETEGEGSDGPPPLDFDNAITTSVLDGGKQQVVDVELKTGKYVFVCFIPDRAGGPPHVAKGMISEVTVD